MRKKLQGIIPAMITPLRENGEIDRASVQKLVDRIIGAGANGVMILGSVGEGMDMPRSAAYTMMEQAVDAMAGRGIVVAGTGALELTQSLENIRQAKNAGVDAVLHVPPFYQSFPQEVLCSYFLTLAEKSPLPLMLYNIPEFVKVTMDVATIGRLAEHENIIGVKDSSGNIAYFQNLICNVMCDKFSVFMGRASLALTAWLLGADGVMSPTANLAPQLDCRLHRAVGQQDMESAKQIIKQIQQLTHLFNTGPYPVSSNIKAILSQMGICQNRTAGIVPALDEASAKRLYAQFVEVF